jgi:hypothetical protein
VIPKELKIKKCWPRTLKYIISPKMFDECYVGTYQKGYQLVGNCDRGRPFRLPFLPAFNCLNSMKQNSQRMVGMSSKQAYC